jgi:hypothetical protein
MPRFSSCVLLALFSVSLGACSSDATSSTLTSTVTDTLGKTFQVSCTDGYCGLSPTDSNLKPLSCDVEYGATEAFALVWWTQILRVHAIQIPESGYISFNAAEPGHPIACVTDADCAPSLFSDTAFTCQYGLCQYISASTPMQTEDVIALCQADIPWPTSCPYITDPLFAARMAEVAVLCGPNTACSKVPADCRQPVAPTSAPDGAAPPTPTPADGGASAVDSV